MAILNETESLILIIDIQEKLLNAAYNKELIIKNASILAKTADILQIPVMVTEQYPNGLGHTSEGLKSALNNKTLFFEKTSFSALENSNLSDAIKKSKRKQIIVFGIETHICVHQTVNDLINDGFDVTVIENASGSRSEYEHKTGIHRMEINGAKIISTEMALFELLKSSKHEKFKEIQALIK